MISELNIQSILRARVNDLRKIRIGQCPDLVSDTPSCIPVVSARKPLALIFTQFYFRLAARCFLPRQLKILLSVMTSCHRGRRYASPSLPMHSMEPQCTTRIPVSSLAAGSHLQTYQTYHYYPVNAIESWHAMGRGTVPRLCGWWGSGSISG